MTCNWFNLLLLLLLYQAVLPQGQLTATIRTVPPSPPFPVATWIGLACDIQGGVGNITFNWTALCTSQSPARVLAHYDNETEVGEITLYIRSTPSTCLDNITCSAIDHFNGNTAQATWQLGTVYGIGFWGTSQPIANNSALQADSAGQIGALYCHSSSFSSNIIGRWISPSGQDITNDIRDAFAIEMRSGQSFPSYSVFELVAPNSRPFTTSDTGVYSCVMPNSNGVIQMLNIGLYSSTYSGMLQIDSVERTSESPLNLNCATTGLPPTIVLWRKDGINLLSNNTNYEMQTILTNRATSSYNNFLTINTSNRVADLEGLYQCLFVNEKHGPVQNGSAGPVSDIESFYIGMYSVGGQNNITCSLISTIFSYSQWEDEQGNVLAMRHLEINLNDSVHNNTYHCREYDLFTGFISQISLKFIINVPTTSLAVQTSSSDVTPILGQEYTIYCVAAKTTSGLVNPAVPQWVDASGIPIVANGAISLTGPVNINHVAWEHILAISSLRTSHAGNYTCKGTLNSPALSSPLIKRDAFSITVQIPQPTVSLNIPSSPGLPLNGDDLSLTCQAVISSLIDTPVAVSIIWRGTNGTILNNSSRVTTSDVVHVSAQVYQSILTITELNSALDSGATYTCVVMVSPNADTPFLLASNPVTSPYTITIDNTSHTLSVTLTPRDITVRPHINFVFTCTATASTTTPKVFTWSKRASGSATSTTLTHNGGSVVITSSDTTRPTSMSVLSTSETQAGSYVYTCTVSVGEHSLQESSNASVTIRASSIPVTVISSNQQYKAGTRVELRCEQSSRVGIGSLSYEWTSTCSGECFVTDQTTSSITREAVRAVDSGTHTCTITDSVGNYGSADISFAVTGVALYHSQFGVLANNSVIQASGGVLGSLYCISGRTESNTGQWIAPNMRDFTQPGSHPFQVGVGGADNPGYVSISLAPPGHFQSDQWAGVYSCVIPDENGVTQTLFLGIHISTTPSPVVQSLEPSTVGLYPQFTLNCSSSRSAATNVTWRKSGVELSHGVVYDFVQIVSNGVSSTYDNLLRVFSPDINELAGDYSCDVSNSFGQTTRNTSLQGIRVSQHTVFSLGDTVSITCSSDLGVDSVQWLLNDQVETTSSGSQAELRIESVTDSIHNRQYTCQAVAPFGTQQHTINILVEVDAEVDFNISISTMGTPTAGHSFNMTCVVTKAPGLQNQPTLEWFDSSNNPLTPSQSRGVTVGDVMRNGNSASRTLHFASLDVSHTEEFVCKANVTSLAPPHILTKTETWNLIVDQILPSPSEPTIATPDFNTGPNNDHEMCRTFFQLLLGPVNDCQEWRFVRPEEKINAIIHSLVGEITKVCSECMLSEQDIANPEFSCESAFSKSVFFRAKLSGDTTQHCPRVLSALENWVMEGEASLLVQSNRLKINPLCAVEISSISTDLLCTLFSGTTVESGTGGQQTNTFGSIVPIAAGAASVLVVVSVFVMMVIIGVFCVKSLRKRKRAHQSARQASSFRITDNPTYFNTYSTREGSLIRPPALPPRPDSLYEQPVKLSTFGQPAMSRQSTYIEMNPAPIVDDIEAIKKSMEAESEYEEIPAGKRMVFQYNRRQ